MQKFQDLLAEAAQLKQQQLKQERRNFQSLPEYLKSGLNYSKKYVQLRKQHYVIQKHMSERIKNQGNRNYRLQRYSEALAKYQEALSIFRYVHATKYENLKDEDIIYEKYDQKLLAQQYIDGHDSLMLALYLNICSTLTKLNKKQQALHAVQQGIKIKQTAKAFYKKAQVYLQYINHDSADIKLGFYYLNKAYQLSKDEGIIGEMHRVKKSLEEQHQKEKKLFKFIFDKSKQNSLKNVAGKDKEAEKDDDKNLQEVQNHNNQHSSSKIKEKFSTTTAEDQGVNSTSQQKRYLKYAHEMTRLKQQNQKYIKQSKCNKISFTDEQKTKQQNKHQLRKYTLMKDDEWLAKFQQQFIRKHGSKIYSVLHIYNSVYLLEFKALLAMCLLGKHETDKESLTKQEDKIDKIEQPTYARDVEPQQAKEEAKRQNPYSKLIEWMKRHPIENYMIYLERYDSEIQWINQSRKNQINNIQKDEEEMLEIQSENEKNNSQRLDDSSPEIPQFEQIQQQDSSMQIQEVPQMVRKFLQNPRFQNSAQQYQNSQNFDGKFGQGSKIRDINHFSRFLKTLCVVIGVSITLKLLF